MTVFAIEKPKKTYKPGFVLMILVVAVVISFSIGLLAGYLAIKENEKDGKNTRSYSVDELLEIFSAEHVKNTIRYFSQKPHQAGSRHSEELADEIKRRWNKYGFQVHTSEYNVLLPRAKDENPDYMEIKGHAGNVIFRHAFAAVGKSDPDSNETWTIPRFYFYSPNGSVDGGLLYVNEGTNKDFEYLNTINITSCNGSIVLMKTNFIATAEQLKNAYGCNASGVLFFNDYVRKSRISDNSSVYPNGTRLPEEQPVTFSLRNHYMEVGDPLTPDFPASDGMYRLQDVDWPAKIPVQHVEFHLAMKLLDQLEGIPVPKEWELDNTTNFRIGPLFKNKSSLHLTVNSKAQMTKVYDVIGTVYGHEDPDSWILVGNHRDAITFGAGDAGSGTAGMMELSRGVSELLKKGWKPRRTIKFCSWAAEETGIIGSTEYVQDNKMLLQERAVAYVNMDMLVHGNGSLKATGNPLTADLMYGQSNLVSDPHGPQESIYSVWKKHRPDMTGKDRPQYHTVGFGSDYIPFYEMAGVPSIDLQYAKVPYDLPPSYHTVYDTYHYISMLDPHFQFHLAQIKLAARIVYKLSHAHLIPFNLNSFTSTLREIVNRTKNTYGNELEQHGISLSGISQEVKKLTNAGRKFEATKEQSDSTTDPKKIRLLNRRMTAFNKLFISPEPIPSRFNMRNLVLGISRNGFYPNITLTGISDAFLVANTSGKWEIVKRQVSLTHHAITQARRSLEIP